MQYSYTDRCSLLVSSCDNYQTAWYPFFELIKKYWPNHPRKVYLNTESISYRDDALDITCVLGGTEITWSERLYHCLEQIETEYIIFSLEDPFLLGHVNDAAIEQCLKWMEEDESIAVCRLKESDDARLVEVEQYAPFRLAGDDVPYRLETQVALWRRSALMEFIDFREDPWQFEKKGTERIKGTKWKFLWYCAPNEESISRKIFPYHYYPKYGYGIAWGRWLWNNKPWFRKNGIRGVQYRKLGILPHWAVKLRFRFLYRPGRGAPKGIEKVIWKLYRLIDRLEKGMTLCRIHGIKKGIREITKRA